MCEARRTEYEEVLKNAGKRTITKEEALFLFENSKDTVNYARLFETASSVRKAAAGNVFRLDGWMGSNTECKIDPPCKYCRRAIPGRDLEKWEVRMENIPEITEAFKKTGTTTVEIGGGTNPETAGPTVIQILRILRDAGLNVWVNVGPALEQEHILEMKKLGVEAITSSFETMNEEIFQRIKPGDSLAKRKRLAHLINENGVKLVSVLMTGLGESFQDRVEHLFHLKSLENFQWLCVTWLRVYPGSPLEGNIVPPSPIEAARTAAIARLIFRNIDIGISGPQHIQLSIMAGANRLVHAGASLHKKDGFHIGGEGFTSGIERIEVVDGYELSNLLPVTARWVMDAGMEVEPSILQVIQAGEPIAEK